MQQLLPKYDKILSRVYHFSTRAKFGALINIDYRGSGFPLPPRTPFPHWRFPDDLHRYLDEQIELLLDKWSSKNGIDDDAVPVLYPRFGIAEHSAFVAGEVDYEEDTSYARPCVKNLNELSYLTLREDTPWLRMVTEGISYLAEESQGRYAVAQRGAMSPLDLANALRGNDLFTDFYDTPEAVHRLLDFCVTACAFYIDRQIQVVPRLNGGSYSGCYTWLPDGGVGHWSEDTSVLCSARQYREFGRPYTLRLAARYNSILVHLHTAGAHSHADILTIPGIEMCELANDPGTPRGIDLLRDHRDLYAGKTLKLFVTPEEIRTHRDFLRESKTLLFCRVNDLDEAKDVVNFVRCELPVS